MVALNVLLLRYQTPTDGSLPHKSPPNGTVDNEDTTSLLAAAQNPDDIGKLRKEYRNIFVFKVLAFQYTVYEHFANLTFNHNLFTQLDWLLSYHSFVYHGGLGYHQL